MILMSSYIAYNANTYKNWIQNYHNIIAVSLNIHEFGSDKVNEEAKLTDGIFETLAVNSG